MRKILIGFVVAGAAWGQTMTEFGAAAATGTVGGAGGKGISEGLSKIFGKVDDQTKAAAKPDASKADAKKDPANTDAAKPEGVKPDAANSGRTATPPAGSGSPSPASGGSEGKSSNRAAKPKSAAAPSVSAASTSSRSVSNSVPDPPAPAGQRTAVSRPAPPRPSAPIPAPAIAPVLPPPPPREVTSEDLKGLAPGTNREDLLKLGLPSSRITMVDDGHLLEIYSYVTKNSGHGVVRLSDGAVLRVELR